MSAGSVQTAAFSVQRASRGNVVILTLQGHLGNKGFVLLERELKGLPHLSPQTVILDCSGLASIASVNLVRLFLVAQTYRKHPGGFRLAGLSAGSRTLAHVVGFDPYQELQPDVETALKSLKGEPGSTPASPEQESKDSP